MRVEPLIPDAAPQAAAGAQNVGAFGDALDAVANALTAAGRAEDTFAAGSGSLHDAVYERARADVVLSIATAAAQRAATAITSILNMQV